jgi:alginate O-acetyltransferase complex protein AlgI
MLFHTQYFLIFFSIVFTIYYLLQAEKSRKILLLASSLFFYGFWNVPLISLMLFSAFLDYYCGNLVYSTRKKRYIIISLTTNLVVLAFFKYANFGIDTFIYISRVLGLQQARPVLDIVLPLGISFYTFQSMSYTIDMYRRAYRPFEKLADFALYILFFPQLVAGPIVRADYFKKQIHRIKRLRWSFFYSGVNYFAIGAFKKIVLADQSAVFVNLAFSSPQEYSGPIILAGVLGFSFQIYFDFSGYTDMARGLGFMLGYHFPENFNYPYAAAGLRDFWRRWHLSLSTWLRDYLYIPLGGSRTSESRIYLNLMITMLLGGLWHGAGWNFVIWGGLHGSFLVSENLIFRRIPIVISNPVSRYAWVLATYVLVTVAWVFFRSENPAKAIAVIKAIGNAPAAGYWSELGLFKLQNWILGFILPAGIILVGVIRPVDKTFKRYPLILSIVALLVIIVITIVVSGATGEFIYFQF